MIYASWLQIQLNRCKALGKFFRADITQQTLIAIATCKRLCTGTLRYLYVRELTDHPCYLSKIGWCCRGMAILTKEDEKHLVGLLERGDGQQPIKNRVGHTRKHSS
jgi:hypothetical protein